MKTLAQYQVGMPSAVKEKHDKMSAAEAKQAEEELRAEAMKCEYFGNDCFIRGPDRFMQMSTNLHIRADYFKLLAKEKGND